MEQTPNHLFDLNIDETSNGYLTETAKWARFLAIVGFISCGLMIILGLFMGTFMGAAMASSGLGAQSGILFSVIYIAFAGLFVFPCLYLFKFSKSMQVAMSAGDSFQLVEGLKNLKSCFKFMGILTIVILSIYALSIVAVAVAAAFTV